MNYYRLYFFNSSGSIRHMAEMECAGDDAALARAAEQAGAERIWELWNRDRLVRRHDGAPMAPAGLPAAADPALRSH